MKYSEVFREFGDIMIINTVCNSSRIIVPTYQRTSNHSNIHSKFGVKEIDLGVSLNAEMKIESTVNQSMVCRATDYNRNFSVFM